MRIRCFNFFALSLLGLLAPALKAQVPQLINYQGRVVVGSTNFNGTGQFKFALVNASGSQTFWSNDGTSSAGSEPTAAVSLSVSNGLYSVLLGDTSVANMTNAIPASAFNNSDVRLRVWFNDATHGSQRLTPDERIAAVGYAMNSISAGTLTGTVLPSQIGPGTISNDITFSNPTTMNGSLSLGPSANLSFGSQTRQMLNLWGSQYGVGVQTDTEYFRSNNNFGWYRGGGHDDGSLNPGTGGQALMSLTPTGLSIPSTLSVTGNASVGSLSAAGGTDPAIIAISPGQVIHATTDLFGPGGSSSAAVILADTTHGTGIVGSTVDLDGVVGLKATSSKTRSYVAGVYGESESLGGNGVVGVATNGANAVGVRGYAPQGIAGHFDGSMEVTGSTTLSGALTANGGGTSNGAFTISAPNSLSFGSQTRQMLNLWGTTYGVGVQTDTQYFRSNSNFAWYRGGIHTDSSLSPGTGGTNLMQLDGNGVLKIVPATGRLETPVLTVTGGSDLAEPFRITHPKGPHEIDPGTVLVIDEANPGQLVLSTRAYDTRVAGVISGAGGVHPGLTMRQKGVLDGDENVALSGRVYVKACNANGKITPGDLLTTSAVPGYAQKVTDHALAQGAILGKAMSRLESETGLVLVLVSLQ